MRVIRGFPAQGIIACFDEAPGGGDPQDFNAPCNAPARDPYANLDRVFFHSEFFQFELAFPEQAVTIGHPQIDVGSTTLGITNVPDTQLGFTISGRVSVAYHTLVTHNLGYVPKAFVSLDGSMVTTGRLVQREGARSRFITPFANSSVIGLYEVGYSSNESLPATNRTYNVLVFRTPTADPGKPLWQGQGTAMQMGRGKIDIARQYLRRKPDDQSHFDIDLGRTLDIRGGRVRSRSGGIDLTEEGYPGGFGGSAYVPVGL